MCVFDVGAITGDSGTGVVCAAFALLLFPQCTARGRQKKVREAAGRVFTIKLGSQGDSTSVYTADPDKDQARPDTPPEARIQAQDRTRWGYLATERCAFPALRIRQPERVMNTAEANNKTAIRSCESLVQQHLFTPLPCSWNPLSCAPHRLHGYMKPHSSGTCHSLVCSGGKGGVIANGCVQTVRSVGCSYFPRVDPASRSALCFAPSTGEPSHKLPTAGDLMGIWGYFRGRPLHRPTVISMASGSMARS